MQAGATKVQGLCGKRRMAEGEGSSMDKNSPPSKFPKLHNESILPCHNTDDFLFNGFALPANVFNQSNVHPQNTETICWDCFFSETTFCDVPSPCWDCFFSFDCISQNSLSEDITYCYNTVCDSCGSAFDDNIFSAGNNDWINQPEVNSNGVQLISSVMNQPEVHPNSVQLADETCVTNKDLDSTSVEIGLPEKLASAVCANEIVWNYVPVINKCRLIFDQPGFLNLMLFCFKCQNHFFRIFVCSIQTKHIGAKPNLLSGNNTQDVLG